MFCLTMCLTTVRLSWPFCVYSVSIPDRLEDVCRVFLSPVSCLLSSPQWSGGIPLVNPTHVVFGSTSAETMQAQMFLLSSRRLSLHFPKMGSAFQSERGKAPRIGIASTHGPLVKAHVQSGDIHHLPPVRMIYRDPPLHPLPTINLCTAWQESTTVSIMGQITCSIIYNFAYIHFSLSSSFAQTSPQNILYHLSYLKILIAFKRGTLPTPLPLANLSSHSSPLPYDVNYLLFCWFPRRSYISENTCLLRTTMLFVLLTDRAQMGIHLSKNSSGP